MDGGVPALVQVHPGRQETPHRSAFIEELPSRQRLPAEKIDASTNSSYTLGGNTHLQASGIHGTPAAIKGGTSVNIGSQPLALNFTPVSFSGDGLESGPATLDLTTPGQVMLVVPASTGIITLTRSAGVNPATYGDSLTFRAVLSPDPGNGKTVTFKINNSDLGPAITTSGVASLTVANLAVFSGYTVSAAATGYISGSLPDNRTAGIRRHLESLADIAQKHDELEPHIHGFFGEAFFNILSILSACQDRMPKARADFELMVTSGDDNPPAKQAARAGKLCAV